MTDEGLIAAVARSVDSDLLPAGYRHGRGFVDLIERLVAIGVMPPPHPADPIASVVRQARACCQRWQT